MGSLSQPAQESAGKTQTFSMSTAPAGWLKANGAAVSRTAYAALFAAIGTTYGVGDGSTTFNLPDLRGEFIRGWDDGRGVDSGRAIGSWQAQDIQPHTHSLPNKGHVNAVATPYISGADTSDAAWATGSAGTAETRPRSVAQLMCIKY